MGRVSPQLSHVVTAMVISETNTSASAPAAALPSSRTLLDSNAALTSASRWSEAFGLDVCGQMTEVDERVSDGFDERRRPAHEAVRCAGCRPSDVGEQVSVDPA